MGSNPTPGATDETPLSGSLSLPENLDTFIRELGNREAEAVLEGLDRREGFPADKGQLDRMTREEANKR